MTRKQWSRLQYTGLQACIPTILHITVSEPLCIKNISSSFFPVFNINLF